MAARFQAVGADEASLPGEFGGEHWHTDEYQDVCFLGFVLSAQDKWSLDHHGWSGR